jgi:hypothetical protein
LAYDVVNRFVMPLLGLTVVALIWSAIGRSQDR